MSQKRTPRTTDAVITSTDGVSITGGPSTDPAPASTPPNDVLALRPVLGPDHVSVQTARSWHLARLSLTWDTTPKSRRQPHLLVPTSSPSRPLARLGRLSATWQAPRTK